MAPKSLLLALAALVAVPALPVLAGGASAPSLPAPVLLAAAPAEPHTDLAGSEAGLPPVTAFLSRAAPDLSTTVRAYGCADSNYPELGRFQLVYAWPRDAAADFYSIYQPLIRANFEAASLIVLRNSMHPELPYTWSGDGQPIALNTNPSYPEPMRLRAECDDAQQPTVADVRLSTTSGTTTFASIRNDLLAQGYGRSNTKYVVFLDGPLKVDEGDSIPGGLGERYDDDRDGAPNANNQGPMFAMVFMLYVDRERMYGYVLHEVGHTMGAVQRSAPHSTEGGHCWDGLDTMCYDDNTDDSDRYGTAHCPGRTDGPRPFVVQFESAAFAAATVQPDYYQAFDCDRDDYFNPHPTWSNHLCLYWNIGARYNRFVEFLEPARAPLTSNYCY